LDFLVRFQPYQGLLRTPKGAFILLAQLAPDRGRQDAPRRGALFSMSASFHSDRSAALIVPGSTMAQNPEKCKKYVDKTKTTPNSGITVDYGLGDYRDSARNRPLRANAAGNKVHCHRNFRVTP
jgi:hypothetical protein